MIEDLPTFAMGAFSFILNVILCMQIVFYHKYYDQIQPTTTQQEPQQQELPQR